MKVGANFLTEKVEGKIQAKYNAIYQTLIQYGYLDTLKYPGKFCDTASLLLFLDFASQTHCGVDIHGLPGMLPATHDRRLIRNVGWDDLPTQLWDNPGFTRISTHIGLDNVNPVSDYTEEEFEQNLQENIREMKEHLQEKTKREILFGGENQPGGYGIDLLTLTPEFISEIWAKMDFGVLDISHAKNAAKDLGITYPEYLARLTNRERVKILHISGNVDQTGNDTDKPDKHILTDVSELADIQKTIETFPQLDLVLTEYVYSSKYACEKEIVIEIVTLATLVKTGDIEKGKGVLTMLEQELAEDASNLIVVLEKIKE